LLVRERLVVLLELTTLLEICCLVLWFLELLTFHS